MVDVIALVRDNVLVNQKLAMDVYKPLIGCTSHGFNLAIKDMINTHDDVFKTMNKLIGKLKYRLLAACLRNESPLAAMQMNETGRSSAFAMLKRYLELRDVLPRLNDASFDALMPSTAQNHEIDDPVRMRVELEEIQLDFQSEECSMLSSGDNFDVVLSQHPGIARHLNKDARIVHITDFEHAVFLIEASQKSLLSMSEAASVACMSRISEAKNDCGKQTLMESAREKRKLRDATAMCN